MWMWCKKRINRKKWQLLGGFGHLLYYLFILFRINFIRRAKQMYVSVKLCEHLTVLSVILINEIFSPALLSMCKYISFPLCCASFSATFRHVCVFVWLSHSNWTDLFINTIKFICSFTVRNRQTIKVHETTRKLFHIFKQFIEIEYEFHVSQCAMTITPQRKDEIVRYSSRIIFWIKKVGMRFGIFACAVCK